jgi:hypothetical protein
MPREVTHLRTVPELPVAENEETTMEVNHIEDNPRTDKSEDEDEQKKKLKDPNEVCPPRFPLTIC